MMDRTISSFLQQLIVEKGFSRNTADAYRNDLGQFWTFLQAQTNDDSHKDANDENGSESESSKGSFTWATVDIEVLNKYIQDLRIRKRYRDTTTARKVASIKSFFGFLSENSIIAEDPTGPLRSPRIARVSPKFLSEEEVALLLESAYKSGSNDGQRRYHGTALCHRSPFRRARVLKPGGRGPVRGLHPLQGQGLQ